MKRCGLYFGSFNPFHIGHLAIANYLVSFTDLDMVRMILSPRNPLKVPVQVHEYVLQERLEHIRRVLAGRLPDIEVSDVEFHLPQPLYTINTLRHLEKQEPGITFVLVMGADNLAIIESWYEWKFLLSGYEIYVYPREGVDVQVLQHKYGHLAKEIKRLDAPLINVSSTFVREGLAAGKNMNGFLV
jgi:nicotinate-nucleotide adenylyltransferase